MDLIVSSPFKLWHRVHTYARSLALSEADSAFAWRDPIDRERPWQGAKYPDELAQLNALPAWLMPHEMYALWYPNRDLNKNPTLMDEIRARNTLFVHAIEVEQLPIYWEVKEESLPYKRFIEVVWLHRDDFVAWIEREHFSWLPLAAECPLRMWWSRKESVIEARAESGNSASTQEKAGRPKIYPDDLVKELLKKKNARGNFTEKSKDFAKENPGTGRTAEGWRGAANRLQKKNHNKPM